MLKDAARSLKINYSTAKTIMRVFHKEKRIKRKYRCNTQQTNLLGENSNKLWSFKIYSEILKLKENFETGNFIKSLEMIERRINEFSLLITSSGNDQYNPRFISYIFHLAQEIENAKKKMVLVNENFKGAMELLSLVKSFSKQS